MLVLCFQASWFLDMIRSVAALSTGEVLVPTVPARNALQLWAPDFRCVLRELTISACPDAFVYNYKSGDLVSCLRDAVELQTVPALSTQVVIGSGLAMSLGSGAALAAGLPKSGSKADLKLSAAANKENASVSGSAGKKLSKGVDREKGVVGAGVPALACTLRKHITAADLPPELVQGNIDQRAMPSLAGKSISSAMASLKSGAPTSISLFYSYFFSRSFTHIPFIL